MPESQEQIGVLKTIWRGWLAVARTIGRFNTLLVLTLIYLLVVPFFALWRLRDPLRISARSESMWVDLPEEEKSVDRFSRPY